MWCVDGVCRVALVMYDSDEDDEVCLVEPCAALQGSWGHFVWALCRTPGLIRTRPLCFLAGCYKRRLNRGFVILFVLATAGLCVFFFVSAPVHCALLRPLTMITMIMSEVMTTSDDNNIWQWHWCGQCQCFLLSRVCTCCHKSASVSASVCLSSAGSCSLV